VRVFAGIGLPPEMRRALAAAVDPFRRRLGPVAWVAEGNLHVTLKFLGEVAPGRIPEIERALAEAARCVPPFRLVVAGVGAFPGTARPRVLWAGVPEPLELVGKLQQNMETILSGAGFPREERAFHPHVTLGRARGPVPPQAAEAFFGALSGRSFGTAAVASLALYESRLCPGGARYTVLREFPLGCGGPNTGERR